MCSVLIHRFSTGGRRCGAPLPGGIDPDRPVWDHLAHLVYMDRDQLAALGLEQLLTTSELADYLGVKVQAIYDLRADGRGPIALPVGRELRFRASEVRRWLDCLHEGDGTPAAGGEL